MIAVQPSPLVLTHDERDPLQQAGVTLYQGDTGALLRQLTAHGTQVHAIITSPPYPNGVRDYGIPASVWGGDPHCDHVWEVIQSYNDSPARRGDEGIGFDDAETTRQQRWSESARCATCGAWRGTLGAEPQIDCRQAWTADRCGLCYVCHLIDVLRLCRTVLRPDGVLWLNLGDTFAANRSYRVAGTKGGVAQEAAGRGQRVPDGYKPKDCILVAAQVALAAQADGWWLRAPLIPWIKPNPLPGPWTDRPIVGHEWWLMLTPSEQYWYDHVAVRQPFADDRVRPNRSSNRPRTQGIAGRADGRGYPGRGVPLQNGGRNYRTTDSWYSERRTLARHLRGLADRLLFHQRDGGLLTDDDGMPLAIECGVGGAAGQGVHFAAFPTRLIRPLLRASVPPLVCSQCGRGWTRGADNESWLAACGCGTARRDDDHLLIASPQGRDGDHDDPSALIGRAGLNRERQPDEGRVLITRAQQRHEAAQLRASPHRATMEREAGPAFAHYLRTDYPNGTRAIPPDLRECWQRRGWLTPVDAHQADPPVPEPGIVLDPFAGVMTTLAVAFEEGRRAIGIELNSTYLAAGRARLAALITHQHAAHARSCRSVDDDTPDAAPRTPPIWAWRPRRRL